MKLTLYTDDLREAPVDVLAVGVFSDEPDRGLAFSHLNRGLDGALEQACRDEGFKGSPGQTVVFNVSQGLAARRVVVYGYGPRASYDPEAARRFAGAVGRIGRKVSAGSAAIVLSVPEYPASETVIRGLMQAVAEGAKLGSYSFDQLRTQEEARPSLREVRVAFAAEDVIGVRGAVLRAALKRGEAMAEGAALSRDLVNEPGNTLTPPALAERAKKIGKAANLGVKVLGLRDLERQGMGLLIGVGRGSEHEPRLIHLSYEPDGLPAEAPVVCLVGKGVTFDAGGLSLKSSDNMLPMKSDMGGAAAVLGAMQIVATLAPRCKVHGIVAAVENMPDGRAIRPSDVIRSKKGITVEIINTDAEGRLALADALAYACELQPTDIIDVATLTGACMVALGKTRAGAWVLDEEMAEDLESAWGVSGESFWRMPLDEDLRELLKSDIADIKNLGERWGGAITAALFLKEFVDPEIERWAHLDVAGPVLSDQERGHAIKGATGFGARTLAEYILRVAEKVS